MSKKRLGEVLVELGIINSDQLHTALEHTKKWRKKLGQSLVDNHFITEKQLVHALSSHLGIPAVDLSRVQVTDQLLRTVPQELAEKHEVFPAGMGREGSRAVLKVAMSDPTNFTAITEMEFATGCKIAPVLAEMTQIMHMIRKHYLKIDFEPINIGAENFDSMSAYFPAEMNVVHDGKVSKAGTNEFRVIPEEGKVIPRTGEHRTLPPVSAAPSRPTPPAPSSRDAIPARPGEAAVDTDIKLMALLKLLIDKKVVGKEEYLAELQILLARKGQK